ncbi:hypothetical protein ACFQVA_41720 [Actinomadura keratinilytica]
MTGSLLYEESWELSPAPLPVRLTGPWVLAVPAAPRPPSPTRRSAP